MEKVGDILREKILIVQDPPSYITPTSDFLSSAGYATSLVEQSEQALDKVEQESPDLVILDLASSTGRGNTLLSQLKTDRFTQHIPIIILGSASSSVEGSQWIDNGADDYVDFPFHLAVLNAHIHALLRRSVLYDPITHLPSGTYLKRQVDAWLSKNTPTAVVYVDIDHFASYNSAYGREAGDRVLQYLASLIVDALPRGKMSVGHLGEDDFMLAFPPSGTDTIARTLVDRFAAAQKEFYNEFDFAKQYVPELDPSLPYRTWPLMTLSAAIVTNEDQALTNFIQASSLLNKQMLKVKAGRVEPALIPQVVLKEDDDYPTLLREGHRHFHQRLGRELEQANPLEIEEYAPLLGYHFSEAADYANAARYFQMAGDRARRLYENAEARQHYEKALANLARLPEGPEFLRQRTDVAARYAIAAVGTESPEQILARLMAVEATARSLGGRDSNREDHLTLAQLRLWIARLMSITDRPEEGLVLCQQTLSDAQAHGEEEIIALSSGEIGMTLARQGLFARAIPFLRTGIAYLEKEADWQQWAKMAANLAISLVAYGEIAAGVEWAKAMTERANELKSKSALASCQLLQSYIRLLAGEPEGSVAAAQSCIALAAEAEENLVLQLAYAVEAWGQSKVGRAGSAQTSLMRREKTVGQLQGGRALPDHFAAIAAEVALRSGNLGEALTRAQRAVEIAKEMKAIFAEGLGEIVWAKALAGKTGWRYEEVRAHLISGVNAFEAGQCRVESARARVAWGLVASAVGNFPEAREQLETAVSIFQDAGLYPEAIEARDIIPALAA